MLGLKRLHLRVGIDEVDFGLVELNRCLILIQFLFIHD
jgi:hypothetical protein